MGAMILPLSNRYAGAFVGTMVVFAVAHILVVAVKALRGNVNALNVFAIIDLDAIVPAMGRGAVSFVLSYVAVLVVFLLMYRFQPNRSALSARR